MDEARHLDAFRKRALANGIGLLKAGPGAIGLVAGAFGLSTGIMVLAVAAFMIPVMLTVGRRRRTDVPLAG